MKKQFPLGFWNYAMLGMYDADRAVKDWSDAGMNLCMSPRFIAGENRPEELIAFLDRCAEKGIRLVIDDTRASWNGASTDPEGYKARFMEAVRDFGSHPAAYGFYVGDEPSGDQLADAEAAVRLQRECAPNLRPFINFHPYYDGSEQMTGGLGFDRWIDEFIDRSGLQQISYDRYSQMNPPDAVESGVNEYYKSLFKYTRAAKRHNLPLWVSNLSVGHFRYRCPKEDDLRWQLTTSVASGANCVWWFFMYMRTCRINYRVAPIDELGERTETYEWLSRVQRSFQNQFGALFCDLIHDETWHALRAYGGYPLLAYNEHPLIKNVTCDHGLPALVSLFHLPGGAKYLALVNNSQTESGYFHLYLQPCVKELYRVAYSMYDTRTNSAFGGGPACVQATPWGGAEVPCRFNDVCNSFRRDENGVHNGAWLAPGQMEVYRIEE